MYMPTATFPYGAAHTAELQFLFPMFHGGSGVSHPLTSEESALSAMMVSYWSNFAKSGDPNSAGLPFLAEDNTDAKQHVVVEHSSAVSARRSILQRGSQMCVLAYGSTLNRNTGVTAPQLP